MRTGGEWAINTAFQEAPDDDLMMILCADPARWRAGPRPQTLGQPLRLPPIAWLLYDLRHMVYYEYSSASRFTVDAANAAVYALKG